MFLVCILQIFFFSASAQTVADDNAQPSCQVSSSSLPDAPVPQPADKDAVTLRNLPVHILRDQAAIWRSPAYVRTHDLVWIVPLAAATGAGIATDHHTMSSVVSHDASFNQASINASNVLIGGFIATPAVLFGYGHFNSNAHAYEAGILGWEALANGVIVEQGLKLIFWRERPAVNNAHGLFFQSSAGWDSSFPSSHSLLAWSTAALIAGEYPSHWTQLGVYSLAAGVSVTRVMGQKHFPTDVLVGGSVGWLIGHYVYRVHHRHIPHAD